MVTVSSPQPHIARLVRYCSRVSQVRVPLTFEETIAQMFVKYNSEKGEAASSPDNMSGVSAAEIL